VVSTKDIKLTLSRRVEIVTQPQFLDVEVLPFLGMEDGAKGDWETHIIQLDGTGAATVEVKRDGQQRAFAKLFPDASGPQMYEKLKALRAAGFGPGERYQAVEPLGFIPEYAMLLTKPAEGPAVSTNIGVDDEALVAGAREAGVWLAKLHRSPLRTGPPKPLLESGELLSLARRLAKMLCRRPQYLSLALDMIQALEKLAAETEDGLRVQSHGQYRPIHVFISDASVTVIDLDRSRPCDPARDVAEFLHRMRMTMFWRTGAVEPADAATDAFLVAYRSAMAERPYLTNLRFHWARYIFHSLNRKLKGHDPSDLALDATVAFYRSEFDNVINGRLSA